MISPRIILTRQTRMPFYWRWKLVMGGVVIDKGGKRTCKRAANGDAKWALYCWREAQKLQGANS